MYRVNAERSQEKNDRIEEASCGTKVTSAKAVPKKLVNAGCKLAVARILSRCRDALASLKQKNNQSIARCDNGAQNRGETQQC
jgi:cell division septum initiation protein DivIVA